MTLKKIAIGVVVVILVAGLGLFFWARAVLASDAVRTAVAGQLGRTLGQPVTIGGIGATIFPRVTMTLDDVAIGQPARITVQHLHVGTNLRALLSRRIEHATVRLDGARIELPLPPFAMGSSGAASSQPVSAPVEIVSIDDISLRGVDIVSGGRTLHGDVDVVEHGDSLTIRSAELKADGTALSVTGEISDLDGPAGDLTVAAGALNVNQLLAFVSDFAGGAGVAGDGGRATAPRKVAAPGHSGMNVTVSLTADRATFGDLALDGLKGRARVTADAVTLDPISFGVFGGQYQGTLALTLGATPAFRLHASVSGVDLKTVMAFAGAPDVMTGRLAGALDLTGRGTAAASVLQTTAGMARIEATDGTVKGLGLVRGIVLATSMRSDSTAQLGGTSASEPFSRMDGTFALAGGTATTNDLRFESPDLTLAAAGTIRLDGSAVHLAGPVQLSDKLSQQGGRDLLRYTAQNGRVTLPATVTGSADHLHVGIDMAAAAKRAITNRAKEAIKKLVPKIPKIPHR